MISSELFLLLIGAGIGLVSSLLTLVLSHFFSLREDRIKREREGEEAAQRELRRALTEGAQLGGPVAEVLEALAQLEGKGRFSAFQRKLKSLTEEQELALETLLFLSRRLREPKSVPEEEEQEEPAE